MQEDLQLTLFILGLIAIPAVLLHGLWKIRKSSKQSKQSRYESKDWDPSFDHQDEIDDAPMYDDVGVGKARVVINPTSKQSPELTDPKVDTPNQTFETNGGSTEHEIINEPPSEGSKLAGEKDHADPQAESNTAVEAATENQHPEQFEDIGKGLESSVYGENVVALDKNTSAFQAKPSETHATGFNITDTEQYQDDTADKPVYSNVVTQPKPEFNKPIYGKDSDEENLAASSNPPNFLLKKSAKPNDNNDAEQPTVKDSDDRVSAKTSIDDIPDIANDPDFTLNIQDGPSSAKSAKSKAASSNTAETQKKPEKQFSFTEQAKRFVRRNKKTVAEKIRKEPVLKSKDSEDQMRIDFDDSADSTKSTAQSEPKPQTKDAAQNATHKPVEETDVLVLNVRAPDDNPIEGAALLPLLLTLGFKFGEHDIFHRHVNTNGKGPILFSLTNMFKPGVFDIDNMETFKTYGVSLFMMLPIEGDAQQVFNMMHNAARKISDEFGCRILDGNKVGLSKQSLQQYVERIRDFERKRKTN